MKIHSLGIGSMKIITHAAYALYASETLHLTTISIPSNPLNLHVLWTTTSTYKMQEEKSVFKKGHFQYILMIIGASAT